jgi:hypothetical protein
MNDRMIATGNVIIATKAERTCQRKRIDRGSALTLRTAEQLGEPVIHIHAQMSDAMERLANFLQQNRAETLNVAGSGALKEPGYAYSYGNL